jgi:gamma-glutamylaminecyclotransferase
MTFLLFVYGTLMRDGPRHPALAGQRFLGEARTEPRYALLDLGEYPGLVRREPGGRAVAGELYEVEGGLRAGLDEIEGAPGLFRLGPVALVGRAGPVYAYFYQPAPHGLPTYGAERWDNRRGGPAP